MGGLIGVADQNKNGLSPKNSYLKFNKTSNAQYLIYTSNRSDRNNGAILLSVNKPGQATFMVIFFCVIGTSANIGNIKVKHLSGKDGSVITSVRYIKSTDGQYKIEIHISTTQYLDYVQILNMSGEGTWEWSSSAIPESNIQSQLTAELEAW